MARLAFCGLGQMGSGMAARLLAAGHDLAVWNRTPAKAAALVAAGATLAASPAEAADGAEAVITMLADPAALEAVVFGTGARRRGGANRADASRGDGRLADGLTDDGLADGLAEDGLADGLAEDGLADGLAEDGLVDGLGDGATLIEMSTVGPAAIREVAARLPRTVEMLDAPVLGSVTQVRAGTLKIFVGGEAAVYERWRPMLEVLGTPTLLGPLGTGAAMKLVANSTLGALMTGLGEALALGLALGLDLGAMLDVLVASPIGVTATGKRANIESGTYSTNFRLALAVKDLDLVAAAANQAGLAPGTLRLAEAARAWFREALEAGLGEQDYSAVVARITDRAGGPDRSNRLNLSDQPDLSDPDLSNRPDRSNRADSMKPSTIQRPEQP